MSVGSVRCTVGLLVLSWISGVSTFLGATEGAWGDYLEGALGERLRAAIFAVEVAEADLDASAARQLRSMEQIYVAVRDNGLSPRAARLQYSRAETPGREAAERSRRAALDTIHQILLTDPPRLGSGQWPAALEWLGGRAEARFLPAGEVAKLVADAIEAVDGSTNREIGTLIEQIVPDASETLPDFDVESRLRVALDLWLLRFFSRSEIEPMVDDLRTHSEALSRISETVSHSATRLAELFLQIDGAADATASAATVLAYLQPSAFADPGSLSNQAAESLGSYVRSQLGLQRTTRAFVAGSDPTARFVMRMTARMLEATSDYEHHLLAGRLGVSNHGLLALSESLYVAEHDVMGRHLVAITEIERRFAGTSEGGDLNTTSDEFVRYVEEGESAVERLSEWSSGHSARTGDEYRWAVLSVLSNRYAQYRILTDEGLEADRELVSEFVDEVYGGLPESQPADYAIPTFDRVITTDAPGEVCADFVRRAQGIEALPAGMGQELANGVTLASLWCHTHGLQLIDATTATAGDYITARVGLWFDLADATMSRAEKYAHTVRASFALSDAVWSAMAHPLSHGDGSYLRQVSPRIFALGRMAEELVTFEVAPERFLSAVAELMQHDERDRHQMVEGVADEVAYAAFTLAEVYGGDLRMIQLIREATK